MGPCRLCARAQKSDCRQLRWLGVRRDRPRGSRAAEKCDELAPSHCLPRGSDKGSYGSNQNWERPGLNERLMSALGQKQTCAARKSMSALPPIATSIAFFGMSAKGQKQTNCSGQD